MEEKKSYSILGMHNNRKSILCTRLLDDELITKAAGRGIDIITIPFIQTTILPVAEQQKEILPASNTAIVFTSVNAVQGASSFLNTDATYKIYSLSGATAEAVKHMYVSSEIAGTAENAYELGSTILKATDIKEVYFFHGNKTLHTLPKLLTKNNIGVHFSEVYKTELTPQKISDNFDALIFFSPSAVESYRSENRVDETAVIFTIGKTTAAKLSDINNKIIISPSPVAGELINTIIDFYSNKENK